MKRVLTVLVVSSLAVFSCGRRPAALPPDAETWSVTTWGRSFEVFAEVDPLVAGKAARCNTHVTLLEGFAPLRKGTVGAVLKDGQGQETVFEQRTPRRDGIFLIEIEPSKEGEFELAFRITSPGADEEIPAGRVKVGPAASPGGAVEPPKPPHGTVTGVDTQGVSFLKEQQWRTEFETAWAAEGALSASVSAPARVVAPAGGEMLVTAPVDAVVLAEPWPHRGKPIRPGDVVFQLAPRISGEKSLSGLEADLVSLEGEAAVAGARAERLNELLKLEATSRAEAERARAAASGLDARLAAARRDLDAARGSRAGGRVESRLPLKAAWAGQVAEVTVSPGQSVPAGAPLARLVRSRPVWIDLAMGPDDAARLLGPPMGLLLRRPGAAEPMRIPREAVRLVSRSPEVDPKTATVGVLLEVELSVTELAIGTAVEAEVLLPGERRGVIIPASALVDDSGVLVAYEQLSGEAFSRHEVHVTARQGRAAVVDGLPIGIRVVTRGGAAVRRASLLSTGAPEGHVH